jgi:hypothetical protein
MFRLLQFVKELLGLGGLSPQVRRDGQDIIILCVILLANSTSAVTIDHFLQSNWPIWSWQK